jgi:putative endonuclease
LHYVYILRCADDSLYTGYTTDLEAREAAHNAGKGAKYTRSRRPVAVVYSERFRLPARARAREYALKQLTRAEKLALIVP